jgi:hypothetical protein
LLPRTRRSLAPDAKGIIEVASGTLMRRSGGIAGPLIPQPDGTFFDRGFWAMLKFEKNPPGFVDHFIWTYGDTSFRASRVDR